MLPHLEIMQIQLIGLNARYTHSCLALFYVRNELANHYPEAEVEIQQHTINDSYYQLLLNISSDGTDYYFFSTAIWNSDLAVRLIEDILSIHADAVCVVGGPQAAVVANSIESRRCAAVLGEIEQIDPGFFQDLRRRKLKSKYVSREKIVGFSMPYLQKDFDEQLQNRHIYYETSRGCPFSCSYCLSASQKGVFHKNIETVKSELEKILSTNPKELRFVDRTFNDNPSRCLEIWQILLNHECETSFHFEMSPDRFTEEMFVLLEKVPVGRFEFEIGVQSTNRETLQAIRRPVDTKLACQNISRLAALKTIHLHVDLILGLPHENRDSFLASFRHVFEMQPHYIQMGLLKILPDTPICHTALEYKYTFSKAAPYPVFANSWLNHEVMRDLFWFSECVERFLNNRYFVSFWQYSRSVGLDIVALFLDLQDRCSRTGFFKRSPTQELLNDYIVGFAAGRTDEILIKGLLRYDWLRCGHKFLPATLAVPEKDSPRMIKKRLFQELSADSLSPFSEREKNYFFRKGFFLEFSGDVLHEVGYSLEEGMHHYLCFLPERDTSLNRFCRVECFSITHNC